MSHSLYNAKDFVYCTCVVLYSTFRELNACSHIFILVPMLQFGTSLRHKHS